MVGGRPSKGNRRTHFSGNLGEMARGSAGSADAINWLAGKVRVFEGRLATLMDNVSILQAVVQLGPKECDGSLELVAAPLVLSDAIVGDEPAVLCTPAAGGHAEDDADAHMLPPVPEFPSPSFADFAADSLGDLIALADALVDSDDTHPMLIQVFKVTDVACTQLDGHGFPNAIGIVGDVGHDGTITDGFSSQFSGHAGVGGPAGLLDVCMATRPAPCSVSLISPAASPTQARSALCALGSSLGRAGS